MVPPTLRDIFSVNIYQPNHRTTERTIRIRQGPHKRTSHRTSIIRSQQQQQQQQATSKKQDQRSIYEKVSLHRPLLAIASHRLALPTLDPAVQHPTSAMPPPQRILIVGGGPAGAVAAYHLAKSGLSVLILERSPSPTTSTTRGQGIDITGPAISVIKRMGLYDTVRAACTGEKGFSMLDDAGTGIARLPAADQTEGGKGGLQLTQELEIMRGDMTRILASAAQSLSSAQSSAGGGNGKGGVEYRYGSTLTSLSQSSSSVTATLSGPDGEETTESFTAVIGADGMNSTVRRLAFSPEVTENCYRPIGQQWTAFFSIPAEEGDGEDSVLQQGVGCRTVLIRPIRTASSSSSSSASSSSPSSEKEQKLCSCYLVKTSHDPELAESATKPRQQEQQKEIFARLFASFPGSLRSRLLSGLRTTSDFYVAQTAQIHLPTWSSGRVALVGDAAYAPSPVTGQGTAIAIVGAYILAGELAKTPEDVEGAFERYESVFRPYVEKAQKIPGGARIPRLVNPETRWGIEVLRWVFWVIATTGVWRLFGGGWGGKKEEGWKLPEYDFAAVNHTGEGAGFNMMDA
ncbi:hypothetical protein TI39_contig392g00037 [Zymoseptoria brevis]|uniref:FAD-binding domain-containing protein n=1 Tax=Zymoseptoria brevis TaxID=1047168 RepID=A0A0F4GMW3_9PEZI|nr:hypothetical protein TI39_contig392g00037 [Zymoseptoria brevis]